MSTSRSPKQDRFKAGLKRKKTKHFAPPWVFPNHPQADHETPVIRPTF